jgi:hypothetical protein
VPDESQILGVDLITRLDGYAQRPLRVETAPNPAVIFGCSFLASIVGLSWLRSVGFGWPGTIRLFIEA